MDWFNLVLGVIVGAVLGSFVGAIALRCIDQKSFWGRSHCPQCNTKLQFVDLLPIISYLTLHGSCRYCHKPIKLSYLMVEVIMAALVAIFFINYPNYSTFPTLIATSFKLFVIIILSILFITDLKTGLLPDRITYPATMVAALYLIVATLINPNLIYVAVLAFISGLGAATLFALLIILTRGKGMGWGDVKYALFLGIALGFPNVVVALFLAFLLGALVAIILLILGKKRFGQTIPFGPFLSIGALLVLLWGDQIMRWYFSILG